MKFLPGRLVATPGALKAVQASGQTPFDFLERHLRGDWGQVCEEDWQLNDQALRDGSQLLSSYSTLKGQKIWIITEAVDKKGRRPVTTLLLPDERTDARAPGVSQAGIQPISLKKSSHFEPFPTTLPRKSLVFFCRCRPTFRTRNPGESA